MSCLCGLTRHLRIVSKHSYPCLKNPNWTSQVRWRKPRWIPVAKSKMFNVREPTPINEEEMVEITRLYNNYRTAMKTIRSFIVKWQQDIKTESLSQEEIDRAEKEEHLRLMEINRRWNEEVALNREQRQQKEAVAKTLRIKKEKQMQEDEELKMIEEAIKYVELETEQSKAFITEETLDDEIEKVLNRRKDYNFSLDLDGNKTRKEDKIKEVKPAEQAG